MRRGILCRIVAKSAPKGEINRNKTVLECRGRCQPIWYCPHTDANFLTFLAQSDVPGLQVRMPDGSWQEVPDIPNSYAANSGDRVYRWTNGRFKSTPHRAVPPVGRDRCAIPFFLGPHIDTLIDCLPPCQGPENPPRFEPMTYEAYLHWWYKSNYDASLQDDLDKTAAS
jgi:isopenicillin N synthase-like dioxygenase